MHRDAQRLVTCFVCIAGAASLPLTMIMREHSELMHETATAQTEYTMSQSFALFGALRAYPIFGVELNALMRSGAEHGLATDANDVSCHRV